MTPLPACSLPACSLPACPLPQVWSAHPGAALRLLRLRRLGWAARAWALAGTLGLLAGPTAQAQSGPTADQVQRQRIAQERQQANARYQADAKACQSQFLVSDCLDDAKARQNTALDDLRRQESALNDEVRKRKAADAVTRKNAKRDQQEAQPTPAHTTPEQKAQAKQDASSQRLADAQARAAAAAAKAQQHEQKLAERAALLAQGGAKQKAYDDKQAAAARHKAEVEERLKKASAPAKPLPSGDKPGN